MKISTEKNQGHLVVTESGLEFGISEINGYLYIHRVDGEALKLVPVVKNQIKIELG